MMFSRRPLTHSLLLSLSLATAAPVHAIGVGNIDILSNLNQPLLAKIHILASPDEGIRASNLKVRIASEEEHARYGLPYPIQLKSARFIVTPDGNGGFFIRATTTRPVKEPLLTFLLAVDWGKGRLYKEVTLLLDPPGYRQLPVVPAVEQSEPAPPVAPQISEETVATSSDNRYRPIPTALVEPLPPSGSTIASLGTEVFELTPEDLKPPAPPARKAKKPKRKRIIRSTQRRAAAKPPLSDGRRYGPVKAGDSLSKIARRIAGKDADKATIKALMEAIYAANPHAFAGSMDTLEKGSYLTIPDMGESKPEKPETKIALGPSPLDTPTAIGISNFVTTIDSDSDIVIDEKAPAPAKHATPARPATRETTSKQPTKPAASEKPAITTAETEQDEADKLEILPPDQTAAEISRRMSERMAELDRKALDMPPRTEPKETIDDDPAIVEQPATTAAPNRDTGNAAQISSSGLASLQAEIASLKAERNELLDRLATTETRLEETEAKLQRLELKISALSKSLGKESREYDFSALLTQWKEQLLQWGAWLLLPLLPLLLALLWWRRRSRQVEEIAAPVAPIDSVPAEGAAPPVLETNDIETVETVSRDADWSATTEVPNPLASAPPTEPGTAAIPTRQARIDDDGGQTRTIEIAPTTIDQKIDSKAEAPASSDTRTTSDLDSVLMPPLSELDLKPAASEDDEETIRPTNQDNNNSATQILKSDSEEDANLDSAEETEIYLAYGQFSLAEQTIDKLLKLEPDNDRYHLLQLKLFAETGRMNELQALSVKLLEKYPDPESGMHKQVKNISNRAFTRKALREQTHATDKTEMAEHTAEPAASEQPADERDLTLDRLSVEADKLSASYIDDIGDYISEETLPDLDMIDLEQEDDKTLFEDPLTNTSATAPRLKLDEEDLTESELDALTAVDLELKEAKLELDNSGNEHTAAEGHIEEFSDTDLRLDPIDLDAPGRGDDRLDIGFDLESELEKHDDKV